jgi:hypothetical protein
LISIESIEQLPASSEFTAILVIIDRFTKQAIFVPTTDKVTLQDLVHLFVLHVFSKHGIPSHVTSDRGSKFVSILDAKIDNRRKKCKLLYLVRWMGYEGTDEETLWIITTELDHDSELVRDFHASYPGKPAPLAA